MKLLLEHGAQALDGLLTTRRSCGELGLPNEVRGEKPSRFDADLHETGS